MKLVILSNYFNHHQKPICDSLFSLTDGDFAFISTTVMSEERKKLGYGMNSLPEYVFDYNLIPQKCKSMIDNADTVIFGTAPEDLLKNRLNEKKLIIRYSERIYKEGCPVWKLPVRAIKYAFKYTRHKNLYMLCASAYTAGDYAKTGTYIGKTYKWGYFPEYKSYEDINKIINDKKSKSLLWVARFLDWKHPELPLYVAKQLKQVGYDFELNLIGSGQAEDSLNKFIIENSLQDCVHILGSMKPEQVREYMEKSQIFLFTSDRNEGWGAVLNESMNSGCAVVVNHEIGAVPYLIKNENNGLIYRDNDFNSLYDCVKRLLNNEALCKALGLEANNTISSLWNAEVAAERLLEFVDEIKKSGVCHRFEDGPCSKASIIKDNWFKG